MIVQIIKEYQNRTEFKVLKKFVDVKEVALEELENGVLVLSGIVLSKIDSDNLKKWLENPANQLMILPPWVEMDLTNIFGTSININIKKEDWILYEEVKCDYKIEGKFQDIIYKSGKCILGVNYRKDTSTGILTILTLPLLDYKLTSNHEKFKGLLLECIILNDSHELEINVIETKEFEILPIHEYIIMLKAAGYELNDSLNRNIKKIFGANFNYFEILTFVEELKKYKFIEEKRILDNGMEFIATKRFKPFIRVLKERRLKDGET